MKQIPSSEENGIVVFSSPEYVDLEFKTGIEKQITEKLAMGKRKFLFDMSASELINSHGASAFLKLFKDISNEGGLLGLCSVNEAMVQVTFQEAGLLYLCKGYVFDTQEEALEALKSL